MKQKITFIIIGMVISIFSSHAQAQFWSDTFEDAGAPSSGTRTPENNTGTGSPLYTSYFVRTDGTNLSLTTSGNGSYISQQGTKFWAGEDHDTPFGAGNEEQEIVWSGINISGKSNLLFSGLLAANNLSAAFDSTTFGAGANDYVIVEYKIDGGSYLPLLRFFANNGTISGTNNKSLALDTDNNNLGDGTILSFTFQNFDVYIPSTGTTLDLRVRAFSNGSNEEWAIDNFRLFENALAVDDFQKSKVLKVYPNPAKDNFRILSQQDASITLYNQLGQNIKQFKVSQNIETLISNEGLSKGVYFLIGNTSDGKKFNEKIVIE